MDGPCDYHTKSERQMPHDVTYMWNLNKNDRNECIYKAETDSQTWKTNYRYQGERKGRDKLGAWD